MDREPADHAENPGRPGLQGCAVVPAPEEQGIQARAPTHAGAQGAAPMARQEGQADDQPAASLPAFADSTEAQPQPGASEPEQMCARDAEAPASQWPSWVPSLRNVCLGLLGGAGLTVAGVQQLLAADRGFEEAWQVTGTTCGAAADGVDHGRTLAALGTDEAAAGAALGDGHATESELRDTVRASCKSLCKGNNVSLVDETLQAPPPLFSNK